MIAGSLMAAALLFSHPLADSGPPRLDQVRASLARTGPKATVADLRAHGRFGYVLNRIGLGDPLWVIMAPELAKGADGADAEGLGIALSEGLAKNARPVLAALDPRDGPILGVSRVCSAPFIEPKPGFLAAYKARAIPAVNAVHLPALAGAKRACLAKLQAVPG